MAGKKEFNITGLCIPISETLPMEELNRRITELCRESDREIILMANEVDRVADCRSRPARLGRELQFICFLLF